MDQRFLIPWIPADRANLGFLFGLLLFSFSLRHIAVVAMVPEQLLAFVGDVRGESRNPIQDVVPMATANECAHLPQDRVASRYRY